MILVPVAARQAPTGMGQMATAALLCLAWLVWHVATVAQDDQAKIMAVAHRLPHGLMGAAATS